MHSHAVQRVLDLFGIAAGSSAEAAPPYVGDTAVDIHAGRAVGARTVGATCVGLGHEEIRAAQPDYLIEQLLQICVHLLHESACAGTMMPSWPCIAGYREEALTRRRALAPPESPAVSARATVRQM
jgi:hypothetical protein